MEKTHLELESLSLHAGNHALDTNRCSHLFLKEFQYFQTKTYSVTIHSNRLVETIRMNGHFIGFGSEMKKFSKVL